MRSIIIVLLSISLLGCQSTENTLKNEQNGKKLKEWIEGKNLKVIANVARPLASAELSQLRFLLPIGSSTNRIWLTGGENFLKISNDTVYTDLAYFGTRQLGGEYNARRNGIQVKGKFKDYSVKYNERKNMYTIRFTYNDKKESYYFTVKLFKSLKADIYVSTSHRTPINYDGFVSVVKTE